MSLQDLLVQENVFVDFLLPHEILKLSRVSKRLYTLIHNNSEWLWKRLCKTYFKTTLRVQDLTYKQLFLEVWEKDITASSMPMP
jgi:hypothetical protein